MNSNINRPMLHGHQKGAVLIVVLIMLILLTIAGTWAIRSSITSLNVATNVQAQSLLMQNSDSVFVTLENKTSDAVQFDEMKSNDGILQFAMSDENNNKELVFCIRGSKPDNFAGSRLASLVYWDGTTIQNKDMGANGFCKVDRAVDFLSSRSVVMTQVTVRSVSSSEDWGTMYVGNDKESAKTKDMKNVVITATSLLPSLSSSTNTQINKCLTDYTSFYDELAKQDTVMDCLAKNNVPYSTQEMQYTIRRVSTS